MASSAAHTTIRRARPEDYEAVVAIGDVYKGRDYLSHYYHSFLNDPDVYAVVAEVNGHVVGFNMLQLLDGGETLIKRAGRVHSSYRGGGIFHLMSNELEHAGRFFFKDAKCLVRSTIVPGEQPEYTEVFRKPLYTFYYNPQDFPESFTQGSTVVHQMNYLQVKQLFTQGDALATLVPTKRLFNYFVPYKCIEANIPHILGKGRKVFATVQRSTQCTYPCFTQNFYRNINMVSFSLHFPGTHGLLYNIDLYAIDNVSEETIRAHIKQHIHEVSQLSQDKGILMVSFGLNIDEKVVRSGLEAAGVVTTLDGQLWKILYEKQLVNDTSDIAN
ncbi:histidine N-acetyltransferase-like [Physella acuta]|uniref:histidine N-acetyltransferase-like n=1 Tax=Physella acuta TaxID=109671 RepID=UPI0027DE453B|nr:histidine N-acetyltransferase-like [Physella acuta]